MVAHQPGEFPRGLRFVFVQMLFALTMGELARETAALIQTSYLDNAPTAYSHLVLAFIVITASWVGWSSSSAPGNQTRVVSIFSWSFAILVLDVVLVICYFIIVKGVEKPDATSLKVTPTAQSESLWMLVVFAGYFLWDFLTKGATKDPSETSTFWQRVSGRHFWGRGYASLLCAGFTLVCWLDLRDASTERDVILADIALLLIVLLFRSLKQAIRVLSALLFLAWIGCIFVFHYY